MVGNRKDILLYKLSCMKCTIMPSEAAHINTQSSASTPPQTCHLPDLEEISVDITSTAATLYKWLPGEVLSSESLFSQKFFVTVLFDQLELLNNVGNAFHFSNFLPSCRFCSN
jgi:hypothetical protein